MNQENKIDILPEETKPKRKPKYFRKTKPKAKVIGDILLVVSGFISETMVNQMISLSEKGIVPGWEIAWATRIALWIGIIGKILTNYFKEEE